MGFWSKFRRSTRENWDDPDIREELEAHLAMDAEDSGSARQSRLRMGNLTRIEEDTRRAALYPWLESIAQDIRYGLRQIRKTPALSAAVVLSLAIGLGANTGIFSLVDAALLRPLPVAAPGELQILEWINEGQIKGVDHINGSTRPVKDEGMVSGGATIVSSVSEEVFRAFRQQQTMYEDVVGFTSPNSMAVSSGSTLAEQVNTQYVSANFFGALGIAPVLGRTFQEDDDQPGQELAVIVSHRFWTNRMGAAPGVIGATLRVNNQPTRVIGVAPPGFFGLEVGSWVDVYAPLSALPVLQSYSQDARPSAGYWWVQMLARLTADVPPDAAAAQATGLFRNLTAESLGIDYPDHLDLLSRTGSHGATFQAGVQAQPLWILLLLVGVLLLIVCANVANLLLSRSVSRQRELAVRAALGAGRVRLFRQQITESGLFALLGGITGLGLGYALAQGMHAFYLAGYGSSSAFDLRIDWRILLFSTAIAVLTAFLFGMAPAIHAARSQVNDTLKAASNRITEGRMWIRRGVVAAQFALCFTALIAAGLLGQSLRNINATEVGFASENLSYATVHPRQLGYDDVRMASYLERFHQQLETIPGVSSAAPLGIRLLSGAMSITSVTTPKGPRLPEDGRFSLEYAVFESFVGKGALETLKIPLLSGRSLEPADGNPDTLAAVVDQQFAARYFPNENAIGQYYEDSRRRRIQVVGIVPNVHYVNLRSPGFPTIYRPFPPSGPANQPVNFAIRSTLTSSELADAVRRVAASIDPAVPITEFHTQTELSDRLIRSERLLAFVSGALGIVALTLAAIGLGGLLIYSVTQRTNEIGVRMALGAQARQIIQLILNQSLWMVLGGIVIGFPLVYFLGQYLEATLFELSPLDPVSMAASLGALILISLLATWLPARRAVRISPVSALREE